MPIRYHSDITKEDDNDPIFEPLWGGRLEHSFRASQTGSRIYDSLAAQAASRITYGTNSGDPRKMFKSIYLPQDLDQFEDAYINNLMIRRALNVTADFILGYRVRATLDTNQDFLTVKEEQEALKAVFNNAEYKKYFKTTNEINRKVELHSRCYAAVIQSFIFGRSVLGIELEKDNDWPLGRPTALRVLNSKRLGQVHVDQDFNFLGLEYNLSGKQPKKFYPSDSLMYFRNEDFNIKNNSLYYGLSKLSDALVGMSQGNMLLISEDLPEAFKGKWSGFGLVQVKGTRSRSFIDKLKAGFKTATWFVHDKDVTATVHKLVDNVSDLIEAKNELDKSVLRYLGVPIALAGFEDVLNRATLQEIMEAWRVSTVAQLRTWFRGVLEKQYFDVIQAQLQGIEIEEVIDQEVKIKAELKEIILDTSKERAERVVMLKAAGIYDLQKALEELDAYDLLDRMQALQQETNKLEIEKAKAAIENEDKEKEPIDEKNGDRNITAKEKLDDVMRKERLRKKKFALQQ